MEPQISSPANPNEQLDRIFAKIVELQGLHRAARGQTLLMGILILLVGACMVWEMIQPLRELPDQHALFMKGLEEQAGALYPVMHKDFVELVKRLFSTYKDAFKKEFSARHPNIEQSVSSEFMLFVNQIQTYFAKQSELRMNHFVEKYRKRLAKDFPDLVSDETKLAKLEGVLQSAFHTVVGTHFQKHFDLVGDMREQFNTLTPSSEIKEMSDEHLQEHILDLATKILTERFKPWREMYDRLYAHVGGLFGQLVDISEVLERETVKLTPAAKPTASATVKR